LNMALDEMEKDIRTVEDNQEAATKVITKWQSILLADESPSAGGLNTTTEVKE